MEVFVMLLFGKKNKEEANIPACCCNGAALESEATEVKATSEC